LVASIQARGDEKKRGTLARASFHIRTVFVGFDYSRAATASVEGATGRVCFSRSIFPSSFWLTIGLTGIWGFFASFAPFCPESREPCLGSLWVGVMGLATFGAVDTGVEAFGAVSFVTSLIGIAASVLLKKLLPWAADATQCSSDCSSVDRRGGESVSIRAIRATVMP
jgi:hypothetical protein